MSWSINLIGKRSAVLKALEAQSEIISKNEKDFSRMEYDAAKSNLISLVSQNFSKYGDKEPILKLTASGHGGHTSSGQGDGEYTHTYNTVNVTLENLYGFVE